MIRLTIAAVLLASLSPGAGADVLCRGNSETVKIRTEACKNNETAVDVEALLVKPADKRFSIMWNTNSFITHSAAIRENASIRASTDPTMSVVKTGTGQYCITAPSGIEGAVGVLQQSFPETGIIRVTAGIGNFCPGATYFVETFSF